jgi:CAAX prenyl protease-like protein
MICAMNFLREKFSASPIYVRVAPFFVFVGLIALGGLFGKSGPFWIYTLRTFLGAYLLWEMRPFVPEMRWAISTEAVAVGVAVFIMWVGLDSFVPKNHLFFSPSPKDIEWNPFERYGAGAAMGWFFVTVRLLGSTFIVAPLEEVFWRSFLYRYCVNTKFESLPLKLFHPTSFIVVSLLFGIEHYEWVQGFLCGMAYQWLVISKNRLGDAIAAHAITNFLLGLWVIGQGAWHFW